MKWLCALALLFCTGQAGAAEPPPAASAGPQSLTLLEAIRVMLAQQPEIQIAEQDVLTHRGALQSARGQFDVSLQASVSQTGTMASNIASVATSYGADTTNTYTTQYQVSGTKQFRSGTTIGASVQVSRVAENIIDPAYGQATVVFSLNQPLLRGRGAAAVAARENAARCDLLASEQALRQSIQTHIRDTAIAYFTYLSAVKAVALWQAAVERTQSFLSDQERLVAAQERPAADLSTLSANLADIVAARTEAENQALSARQALGLVMGIDWAAIARLPELSGELPKVEALPPGDTPALVELARKHRPELLAASAVMRSAGVLTRAAQRDLLPQLDFAAQLGYTGLTEDNGAAAFVAPLADRVPGPNFLASLTFQYPIHNNAARGLLVQRQAAEKQALLQYQNLERQIGANVALSADTLRKAVELSRISESAVQAYRKAVDNERKKLRAGLSTLFDVVLIESRLNSAEQAALGAQARVAAAVVQLRYESGTLVDPQGQKGALALTLEHLTRAPKLP